MDSPFFPLSSKALVERLITAMRKSGVVSLGTLCPARIRDNLTAKRHVVTRYFKDLGGLKMRVHRDARVRAQTPRPFSLHVESASEVTPSNLEVTSSLGSFWILLHKTWPALPQSVTFRCLCSRFQNFALNHAPASAFFISFWIRTQAALFASSWSEKSRSPYDSS